MKMFIDANGLYNPALKHSFIQKLRGPHNYLHCSIRVRPDRLTHLKINRQLSSTIEAALVENSLGYVSESYFEDLPTRITDPYKRKEFSCGVGVVTNDTEQAVSHIINALTECPQLIGTYTITNTRNGKVINVPTHGRYRELCLHSTRCLSPFITHSQIGSGFSTITEPYTPAKLKTQRKSA